MKRRIIALCLTVCTLVCLSAGAVSAADTAADATAAAEKASVVSPTRDAFLGANLGASGYSTAHGNNQSRILYTDSGVYISCPGETINTNLDARYGLWKLEEDGTITLLFEDVIGNADSGNSCYVLADAQKNVWVISGWDQGTGFYQLRAWKYTPSTGTVDAFATRGYYPRGGMYGKPSAIMDAVNNRIYYVTSGRDSPGTFMWTTFDMTTNEWDTNMKVVKINTRCDYHYGYADGKGGFYTVAETCPRVVTAYSNIEGMKVKDAINRYRSRKINADFMWDEPRITYVPDASQEVAYNLPLDPVVYDVENGCYPNVYNAQNDIFLNPATGYLYVTVTWDDNETPGLHKYLYIFDTNVRNDDPAADGPFKLLAKKELSFVYGMFETYTQCVVSDTTGRVYIVAISEKRGMVEIWGATNEVADDFVLLKVEDFTGYVNGETGIAVYGTIAATGRNNSNMTDTVHFISFCARTWVEYSIDFAALRGQIDR